ncbi:Dipeptide/tripeptide permease [Lachnospiraceae bacterium XBB1006]|nr:Dipeptide/tripeptide permease [Lachnospiraceae bacterium XBB1006]
MENTKKKWPFGFYVTALSFSFERCAYYAAKWGLGAFIATKVAFGGLGFDKSVAAMMAAYLVAFTYITPIVGGIIADRFISPRILVPIGEVIMGLGWLCAWQANDLTLIWVAIILVSLGTGLFKGNVSGICGRLFPLADQDMLDSVFNVQYMFVNIGSFCGTTFLALIATHIGFRQMFFVCGLFLFIDCLWWLFGMRFFGDAGKKPFLVDNRSEKDKNAEKVQAEPLTHVEKNRVAAIIVLTIFSGVFWLFWYLVYNPVYYEFGPVELGGKGWADWTIGNFLIPSSWFDSANGLLCIILCPIFAGIWAKMKQRPKGDWSMFTKTAVGIMILGLCLVCMVIAAAMCKEGKGTPVGVWIIFLAALTQTVGEVIFSPLGNSFISQYAPKKLLGTLLGVWPLIIFFVGYAQAPLYNFMSKFSFVKAYGIAAIIVIAIGIGMLAFTKRFEAAIHADEQ